MYNYFFCLSERENQNQLNFLEMGLETCFANYSREELSAKPGGIVYIICQVAKGTYGTIPERTTVTVKFIILCQ